MLNIKVFEVNPFSENTYLLYTDDKEAILFDPGFYTLAEKNEFLKYVSDHQLVLKRVILTHAHLDHIFGNKFVFEHWGLQPEMHLLEQQSLDNYERVCQMYGIAIEGKGPEALRIINQGETIKLGDYELVTFHTPGHSPGSLSFYCEKEQFVLSGDVLFQESVGRSDLPGGNWDVLEHSIRNVLFKFPPETIVLSGHGPATSIRHEMEYNPFVSSN